MRKYKISQSLKNNIENILVRRAILYSITNENNQFYCSANISGEYFHKIVLRAKMEKLQEEDNSPIPYIAHTEVSDNTVLSEIGNAYIVK